MDQLNIYQMYEQRTECIQFWAVLQLDMNGFIKKKREKQERNKHWALKLIEQHSQYYWAQQEAIV